MNIEGVFHQFREHLGKEKERFAPLQLVARLEGYLTLEFAGAVARTTAGKRLALTNAGNKEEQKYDVLVLEGDGPEKAVITHLLESKYLRNRHRISKWNAQDETRSALQSLARQLAPPTKETQYAYELHLSSADNSVYGLVFGSHVRRADKDDAPEGFYRACLDVARDYNLRSFDLPNPGWFKAYEDVPVTVLGAEFRVSLRAALWRLGR